MNTTQLDLLFLTTPDIKNIFVQDTSVYNPDVETTLPLLEITPPNFSTTYMVQYPLLSIIPINSNTLGLTNTSVYDDLIDLADGLWIIKQSVSPKDCLYKVHKHFRIVDLKKQILEYVSKQLDLSNPNCTLNESWYQDIFNMLQLLETAKYLTEQCGKCDESKIIYNQIYNQVKKYLCSDC